MTRNSYKKTLRHYIKRAGQLVSGAECSELKYGDALKEDAGAPSALSLTKGGDKDRPLYCRKTSLIMIL
jgi:hypothetical protein